MNLGLSPDFAVWIFRTGGSNAALSKAKMIERLSDVLQQLQKTLAEIFGDKGFRAALADMESNGVPQVGLLTSAAAQSQGSEFASLPQPQPGIVVPSGLRTAGCCQRPCLCPTLALCSAGPAPIVPSLTGA